MLRRILSRQKAADAADGFGSRLHFGHPCQKHPSMNKATFALGKTKSGLPIICE
jgi:hypothetical protein